MLRSGWLAFSLRAWEAVLAGLLFVVGIFDLFADAPVPPELAPAAPEAIFRVYGLYLAIGSGLVIAAIFGRFKDWSRRVERMGMMLLAGATGSLALVLWEWMRTGIPSDDDTDNIVVSYLLILLALASFGSLARFWALRHLVTIEVRRGDRSAASGAQRG